MFASVLQFVLFGFFFPNKTHQYDIIIIIIF